MPDASGFPTPDEIINGFGKKVEKAKEKPPLDFSLSDGHNIIASQAQGSDVLEVHLNRLSPAQHKALNIILGTHTFIVIGVEETHSDGSKNPATGADFRTALTGDKKVLANVKGELEGVIERLYKKNGIDFS
jgi:hypothetical protein